MRIGACDPGINGGLAVIENSGPGKIVVVDVCDILTIGDAAKREIDVLSLVAWLKEHHPDHFYLEYTNAMPSIPGLDGKRRDMGAVSAFKMGFVAGQIRTCIIGCKIPFTVIHSTKWKKAFGLAGGPANKEASRQLALRLFPDAHYHLRLKRHEARAEALLIARYGITRGEHAAVAA